MKKLIVGNWKMNKTATEAEILATQIKQLAKTVHHADLVVCPPFTAIDRVRKVLTNSNIGLGAQNLYCSEKGAFTGEISAEMLLDVGATYVIIGHSERRQIFNETDNFIQKKIALAQSKRLTPILCVGETLEERENGKAMAVIEKQIKEGCPEIDANNLIVAYEPVWAIGTGKTATPEVAQEVQSFIRSLIVKQFGKTGQSVKILYGGSMKPSNAAELLRKPDIDGGLIGGASLTAEDFIGIAKAAPEC